jgi:hypothetical protein
MPAWRDQADLQLVPVPAGMDVDPINLDHQGRRGRLSRVAGRRLAGLGLRQPRLLLGLGDRPASSGAMPWPHRSQM